MSVVTFSVEVDAPAEGVWEAISDPRNLPQWDRHIARVEGVPASGLREGTRYVTDMKFMGVRAKIRVQVLAWDPPHRAKFQLRGVLEGTVTSTVEPLSPGRSRLEHTVDYRFKGGPIGALAARSLRMVGGARFALRRGTLAQKREIEQRAGG